MIASTASGHRSAVDRAAGRRLPRVAVIGFGYWGPNLVRNLRDSFEAELIGVAELNPERQDVIRRNFPDLDVFASAEEVLETDAEGVVVATPIHTHFSIARAALAAGKHVMVEKPLTHSVADAAELVALARRTGRILMVGHTFLYNPAVTELRRLIQGGELGHIQHIDAARLNLGLLQPQANVIWDLAPHDVSILIHLLGSTPAIVSARGSTCVQRNVHDVAYLELVFESGVAAQVHVSWIDPTKVRRVTVVGDRKMAVYDDTSAAEKIRVYDVGIELSETGQAPAYRYGHITIPHIGWHEPLRLQCDHFAHCIETGEQPTTDGAQGLAVVAVLEAANRSLADGGRRVEVELPSGVGVARPGRPVLARA